MSDRQAPVIALEPLGWIARLRDGGDDGPMPDWRAAAEIVHLDAERCVIKALRGRVRRADFAALRKRLRGLGYRTAYAQRAPGRALPGWERIEAGDLAGWWRWELGGDVPSGEGGEVGECCIECNIRTRVNQ